MSLRTASLTLLLSLLLAPSLLAQDKSPPCEKKEDEFKQQVTITCPDANSEIQQQPQNEFLVSGVGLVQREGQNYLIFTTASDSWNFLDVDTAYMIVNGQNLESELINSENQTQNGSVIEQNVAPLTESELRKIAEAESFRAKIGRAIFKISGHRRHAEYLLSQ